MCSWDSVPPKTEISLEDIVCSCPRTPDTASMELQCNNTGLQLTEMQDRDSLWRILTRAQSLEKRRKLVYGRNLKSLASITTASKFSPTPTINPHTNLLFTLLPVTKHMSGFQQQLTRHVKRQEKKKIWGHTKQSSQWQSHRTLRLELSGCKITIIKKDVKGSSGKRQNAGIDG